jgi:hypothetical protein
VNGDTSHVLAYPLALAGMQPGPDLDPSLPNPSRMAQAQRMARAGPWKVARDCRRASSLPVPVPRQVRGPAARLTMLREIRDDLEERIRQWLDSMPAADAARGHRLIA